MAKKQPSKKSAGKKAAARAARSKKAAPKKAAAKKSAGAGPPFDKILIANRGEIACRIIKSAKRLGIKTVAVYSEADAGALHVEMADEAVAIGPAAAAESYLVIERIVEACKTTGAQAVHPGFGFLSENATFVEALEAAGIAFIGPPVPAIAAMGDKIESKRMAAEAKVSTVPGHMDLIADADEAVEIAREIGYPVMIKASAGGGGKGMRIAADDQEARDGFRSAQNEARASFGDDRIFIEKFIEEPRHIEIQVLADAHGKVLHLGERECSIQRRHQKVVEEAPSPFLDAKTRAAMGAQAVALAQAVDYVSAGTVEFIVDKNRGFYFLEMNTRIQVEHPVTEMVTGLDIVEWMIRIAAGEPLDFKQKDVKLEGWAIETRVYAEDATRNFMPSIGRLVRYREPGDELADVLEMEGRVRVDSGVTEGSEITIHYDPMIAKLVTYAPTRDEAIDGMQAALDSFYIRGVTHNMPFLAAVMAHPRFREGRLSTNFIAEEFPDGFHGRELSDQDLKRLAAVAAIVQHKHALRDAGISGQLPGHGVEPGNVWAVQGGGGQQRCYVREVAGGFRVASSKSGRGIMIETAWKLGAPLFRAAVEGRPMTVQLDRRTPAWRLTHGGAEVEMLVLPAYVAELAARMPLKEPPDLSKYLLSPMPGLLVSLAVSTGEEIKSGQELAVVEAMKMENVLRAARDGVVSQIHANPGDSLAVDQAILEFE